MRVAVGQLWQETNTFNPIPTTRADFEAFGVVRGADLVAQMADTNELGGFIQSLRQWPEPPEIVGLLSRKTIDVLHDPTIAEQLRNGGFEVIANGPDGMRRRIIDEVPKWRDVVAKAGIKPV